MVINMEHNIDVIIVGGGISGLSCAYTLSKNGKKVLVVERGNYSGAKNMFGGAIYIKPTLEIFPELLNSAPIERFVNTHKYTFLTNDDSFEISGKNNSLSNNFDACIVIRNKFDKWCMDEVIKSGGYIAPETVVRELIVKDGKVVGIKTDLEEFYAPITILADGVNSLLAKQIGLRKDLKQSDVAVSVKEVIKLPQNVINERFNLTDETGSVYELFGYPMDEVLGLSFIYTNKNSVSIGLGISIDELIKSNKKPYELLNELKNHPAIKLLIKDGELSEYSAHLIPEGGYKAVPKLYSDGVLVIGDAAMLVNNVHWEGTNLAMYSGKYAAETAIDALNSNDFSAKSLSKYEKLVKNSFVWKDLKSYKNAIPIIKQRKEFFLKYFPKKACELLKMFNEVDMVPKKIKFRKFLFSVFKDRNIFKLSKDFLSLIRLFIEVIK